MERLRLKSAVNANLQNSINISLILHYVRSHGATYRTEISKALRLSLPAVSRAVDMLIEKGYLIERKIVTSTGKHAHEVEINAALGISVGISIELPMMEIAQMDMAGRILHVQEIALDTKSTDVVHSILEHAQSFLQKKLYLDDARVPLAAITLSVPAAIDQSQNRIHAVLFPSLHELQLQQLFQEHFSVPVFLENNENLAALAEKYYMDGIPEQNIVYVTIHHGIGAGIILNGELYRGRNGAAGEIGYQTLGLNSFPRNGMETFEALASIHQIHQIALSFIRKGMGEEIFSAANYSYGSITHQLVGDLACSGSETAKLILAQYAHLLAAGLSNVLVTLNPDIVIVGGQVCDIRNAEEHIVIPLKEQLEKLIPFPVPEIRMTRLGKQSAVIGACQMGLENTILKHYPYINVTEVGMSTKERIL